MFRRDLKLFLHCLCTAGWLLLVLAGLCAAAAAVIAPQADETGSPLKAAVVDNEDSVFSRILVRAVGQTEAVSSLLSVETMQEAEAMEALRAGECAAVILLPEGFVEDILRGREAGGTIVLSPALRTQSTLVAAAARFGETLLTAGQYGVFSGEHLLSARGASADAFAQYGESANTALLTEASDAFRRYFRIETLDYEGTGMTGDAHYASAWTAAVLFLASLIFVPLIGTDCTRPMLSRLRAAGVGDGAFFLWKWCFTAVLRFVLLCAAAAVLIPFGLMTGGWQTLCCFAAAAAFTSLLGICLTLCFGEGTAACVLFSVLGLFAIGGIVPRQMLPDLLARIGDLSPFGAARALLAPAFGAVDPTGIMAAILYAAAAILLIRRHMTRVRAGRSEV